MNTNHPTGSIPLPSPEKDTGFSDANPMLADVSGAFRRIRTRGDYLAVHDGGHFHPESYLGGRIHFQGVQRLRQTRFLVISGGDPEWGSQLFVAKLGSRRVRGGWRSNLLRRKLPPNQDRIVRAYLLDPVGGDGAGLWHAGGLSLCGDILAVPIERSKKKEKSEIRFFNCRNPEGIEAIGRFDGGNRFVPTVIKREAAKAGAAALARLPNGRFLAGVWSDSDAQDPRLDFYLSRTAMISDGFHPDPTPWIVPTSPENPLRKYQTVHFLCQKPAGADAKMRLFMIGLHNDAMGIPHIGRDLVELLEIIFPKSVFHGPNPELSAPPRIVRRGRPRLFTCPYPQANMAAAAGVSIDRYHDLSVYAVHHWRVNRKINFIEFRTPPESRPIIQDRRQSWVDLFQHVGYEGRSLSLVGTAEGAIEDYGHIQVQGEPFDDKVSSLRFQLPQGATYRLYEFPNFNRNHAGKELDLIGDGRIQEIRSLKKWDRPKGFNDKASSSRFL